MTTDPIRGNDPKQKARAGARAQSQNPRPAAVSKPRPSPAPKTPPTPRAASGPTPAAAGRAANTSGISTSSAASSLRVRVTSTAFDWYIRPIGRPDDRRQHARDVRRRHFRQHPPGRVRHRRIRETKRVDELPPLLPQVRESTGRRCWLLRRARPCLRLRRAASSGVSRVSGRACHPARPTVMSSCSPGPRSPVPGEESSHRDVMEIIHER